MKKRDKIGTLGRVPQRSNCCAGQSPEVCGKSVLERSRPEYFGKVLSPMVAVGFLRSLWEKPTWEGVWHHLDPMDSVCLRTASVDWNVPGKYGPHGELFLHGSEGAGDCTEQ